MGAAAGPGSLSLPRYGCLPWSGVYLAPRPCSGRRLCRRRRPLNCRHLRHPCCSLRVRSARVGSCTRVEGIRAWTTAGYPAVARRSRLCAGKTGLRGRTQLKPPRGNGGTTQLLRGRAVTRTKQSWTRSESKHLVQLLLHAAQLDPRQSNQSVRFRAVTT